MSDLKPIVLYDIPSKDKQPVSPNTWKVRYALNYKGLPHTTAWIEYPDIEATLRALGAPHTATWPDGRPYYTLPMVHDPNTGARVVDSAAIARYLDRAYPRTPPLFPAGTAALQAAALAALGPALALPLYKSIVAEYTKVFDARGAAWLAQTRPALLGAPLDALATPEEWARVEAGLAQLGRWLDSNGEGRDALFAGDAVTFVDLQVAALLRWARVGDPALWARVAALHGGRWARLLERFRAYEQIHV